MLTAHIGWCISTKAAARGITNLTSMKPRFIPNSLPPGTDAPVNINEYISELQPMLQRALTDPEGLSGGGVYVGRAGVAMTCHHIAQAREAAGPSSQLAAVVQPAAELRTQALLLCEPCVNGALRPHRKRVTFLEGRAGPLALQAVLLYQQEQEHGSAAGTWQEPVNSLLQLYHDSVTHLLPDECEILYGRAGYLWALLFVQAALPPGAVPEATIKELVAGILQQGRAGAQQQNWPGLMYQWHDSFYLGAAHGVAGILYVLLHVMHVVDELDAEQHVTPSHRDSIRLAAQSLVDVRFPSGNLPSSLGSDQDRLVQWCHGAPGLVQVLQPALHVFPEQQHIWVGAIRQAAEVVWERGLLLKGVGLCHGISGNAYALLTAGRALKQCGLDVEARTQLHRAQAMAMFGAQNWSKMYGVPDRPASLYEGCCGLACLLADLGRPDALDSARFPGFEL